MSISLSSQLLRRYTRSFIVITVILCSSGAIVLMGLVAQESHFHIVNAAGRQRMRSQAVARIAMSASLTPAIPEARAAELRALLDTWEADHVFLRTGDDEHAAIRSPSIDALHDAVGAHLTQTRAAVDALLATGSTGVARQKALAELDACQAAFLADMEKLVGLYEIASVSRLHSYIIAAALFGFLGFLVQLGQLFGIVRPMSRRIHDATLLAQEHHEEIARARDEAEQAARATSSFLANMSHELRTPLNAVIGLSELLEMSELDEEQRDHVTTIGLASKTLLGLIADVLDYSKIAAGGLELEDRSLALPDTLRGCVEVVRGSARGVDLVVELDDELPAYVQGDVVRLRQVVMNFLNNAVKFTEPGGRITLRAKRLERYGNARLRVEVEDTGVGIPPDKLDRLFKSFSQVDASITRKHGGTGLGLAISKNLVEAMGGFVGVHSEPGFGSTFFLNIPLEAAEAPPAPDGSAAQEDDDDPLFPPDARVLLVEDNKVNQIVARSLLETLGVACDLAEDGVEALDAVHQGDYDLIFMDLQMPNMGGLDATRALRAVLPPERLPYIIAMTANAMTSDRDACLEAGTHDYVSKPITRDSLAAALARAAAFLRARRLPARRLRRIFSRSLSSNRARR